MFSTVSAAVALLALPFFSNAFPSGTHRPCTDFQIPITVDAINQKFEVPRVNNDIDAVGLFWDLETWSSPNVSQRVLGDIHVRQTFSINARLCVPENGSKKTTLQVATHGGGFSKSYWDPELKPEKYSYVDASLKAGYSILIYDRLGTGQSEKPDAYDIVQGPTQIEILNQLITLAREGNLTKAIPKHSYSTPPRFEKVVVVGHSIGSILTSGLLTRHPSVADGAVLTGFLLSNELPARNDPPGPVFARDNAEARFHSYPNGYITQQTRNNVQQFFFKQGFFDLDALEYAYSVRDSNVVGEIVGLPLITAVPAPEFSGPMLFANGEYDVAVCNGNCTGTYDVDVMKAALYPKASNVQVHLQPGSGHGLTLHANATGHFQAILAYLDANNL